METLASRDFLPLIIGWILFCAIVIGVVTWLLFHWREKRGPVDILKQRFARGEISREEFEEQRRALDE